jgi:hypothetical protein
MSAMTSGLTSSFLDIEAVYKVPNEKKDSETENEQEEVELRVPAYGEAILGLKWYMT